MRLTLRALLLGMCIALCLPSLLIAQANPSPVLLMGFEVTGVVTGYAPSFGTISIGGQEFLIAEGVNIQSMIGGDPLKALNVGAEVGYIANEDSNGRSVIVGLWVLSTPVTKPNGL